jgi:hypothetical protein
MKNVTLVNDVLPDAVMDSASAWNSNVVGQTAVASKLEVLELLQLFIHDQSPIVQVNFTDDKHDFAARVDRAVGMLFNRLDTGATLDYMTIIGWIG